MSILAEWEPKEKCFHSHMPGKVFEIITNKVKYKYISKYLHEIIEYLFYACSRYPIAMILDRTPY